ncbi:isochorismatase family protein [Streptomyces sp. 1331.2]|uniref:isochorismatase family protein n=1 Tax=Streptomyces sp. 1331.2 TaxID=1938835 RepID=UPI000BCCCDF3|nr:isochorismatase family protein [Streptomyces sp. 1331.2]SOB80999.1 bifunctional isochorismate lyase / aryl carrier protein [Streptomyces sp. 1331.2]
MGLPRIPSYPMPAVDELPANRVAWTVDPARAVLLVHDLQNHFLDAFDTEAAPVPELLGNVAALTKSAGAHGIPVVYSAQPGGQSPAERGLQQDFWGPGIPDDPHATAIADAVAPAPGDTVLTKWKYSAFVRTELEQLLREQGRDQLVITGVYAHIGVQATACDAWMRDVQAFVVADAVADFGPAEHRSALAWVAGRCGVVGMTEAVLGMLDGAGRADGADRADRADNADEVDGK